MIRLFFSKLLFLIKNLRGYIYFLYFLYFLYLYIGLSVVCPWFVRGLFCGLSLVCVLLKLLNLLLFQNVVGGLSLVCFYFLFQIHAGLSLVCPWFVLWFPTHCKSHNYIVLGWFARGLFRGLPYQGISACLRSSIPSCFPTSIFSPETFYL